jgi:F0F1-type ATP synthase assembly protein I
MFEKNKQIQTNPNEILFTKTKGFGNINYAVVSSRVNVGENELSVEQTNRVLFFRGKLQTYTVDCDSIAKVEVKTNFAKGDLISGIVIGVLMPIFTFIGLYGEESPGILVGPIIIVVMAFCAYGKNIIITRKDQSKVIIMSEGFGQSKEISAFCKKLTEKGITIYGWKK